MEIKLYPEVETVAQYKPALAVKRDRKYKSKYQRAKMVAWCLFALLTLCAYLLGMALYGTHTLQQRLNDSKTVTDGRLK